MNFWPVGRHSACSNSAGHDGPPARPSPRSERHGSPAVKTVREAGQTAQRSSPVADDGDGLPVGDEKGQRLAGPHQNGVREWS
jgi:hypothetical protein